MIDFRVLEQVARRAWQEYYRFADEMYLDGEGNARKFVVQNSMPILYFGDLDAYTKSEVRVVTAGINPSNQEFPEDNGDIYQRFPLMRGKVSVQSSFDMSNNYLKSLNRYFKEEPLDWFRRTFEPVLNGMGATFWGTTSNYQFSVVHTDVVSPLATNPTYSDLENLQLMGYRRKIGPALRDTGTALWLELMSVLKPHIVLLAISRQDYKETVGTPVQEWNHDIYTKPLKDSQTQPQIGVGRKVQFSEDFPTLLVSSLRGNRTPYMNFGRYKPTLGESIMDFYREKFNDLPIESF